MIIYTAFVAPILHTKPDFLFLNKRDFDTPTRYAAATGLVRSGVCCFVCCYGRFTLISLGRLVYRYWCCGAQVGSWRCGVDTYPYSHLHAIHYNTT
ncbi:hypothetical protein VTL71DRAFT_3575 [Oculimacula yallundae]|uniref:Uncharacterized protein n=1 Tax=Oculimacula yallundae TaxID=86028 RepID=A0ABR4C844_9HELO